MAINSSATRYCCFHMPSAAQKFKPKAAATVTSRPALKTGLQTFTFGVATRGPSAPNAAQRTSVPAFADRGHLGLARKTGTAALKRPLTAVNSSRRDLTAVLPRKRPRTAPSTVVTAPQAAAGGAASKLEKQAPKNEENVDVLALLLGGGGDGKDKDIGAGDSQAPSSGSSRSSHSNTQTSQRPGHGVTGAKRSGIQAARRGSAVGSVGGCGSDDEESEVGMDGRVVVPQPSSIYGRRDLRLLSGSQKLGPAPTAKATAMTSASERTRRDMQVGFSLPCTTTRLTQ